MSSQIIMAVSQQHHFHFPYSACEVMARSIDTSRLMCVGAGLQALNLAALEMMPLWKLTAHNGEDSGYPYFPSIELIDPGDPASLLEEIEDLADDVILIRTCGHNLWHLFVRALEKCGKSYENMDGLRLIHETATVILHYDKNREHRRAIGVNYLAEVLNDEDWVEPRIKKGVVIHAHAYIGPFARIGLFTLINTGAIIEHHCSIGDNCSIQPGAKLMGDVVVGDNTEIGAGAIITPRVKIGKNCLVQAGAVVTKDVPDNHIVYHNRCEIISLEEPNPAKGPDSEEA